MFVVVAVLPDTIGELGQLHMLDLSCCTKVTGAIFVVLPLPRVFYEVVLAGLPDSIGSCKSLQTLDLSSCDALISKSTPVSSSVFDLLLTRSTIYYYF